MANTIEIDAAKLSDFAQRINKLKMESEEIRKEVDSAKGKLDWQVKATNSVGNNLTALSKRLDQREIELRSLEQISSDAIDLVERDTKAVNNKVGAISLLIASAAVISPIVLTFAPVIFGMGGAISSSFEKFRDRITKENSTNDSDSFTSDNNKTDDTTDTSLTEQKNIIQRTDDEILNEMSERYNRIVQRRGSGFEGKCAAMAYNQMEDIGIVLPYSGESIPLGKDYYKVWSSRTLTSGGYTPNCYEGESALKDLIDANEGKVLNNIVVSFDQRKNWYPSSAGHAMFITEIRDGKVFYMDNGGWGAPEDTPLVLSVDSFLKRYPYANGIVHFTK